MTRFDRYCSYIMMTFVLVSVFLIVSCHGVYQRVGGIGVTMVGMSYAMTMLTTKSLYCMLAISFIALAGYVCAVGMGLVPA